MPEKYLPSMEELKAAENTMTAEQRTSSEKRETVLHRLTTDYGGFSDIQEARKLQIPEDKIKKFALRFIGADIRRGYGHEIGLRIAKNSGVLSENEVLSLARETYTQMLAEDSADDRAAEFLYGTESPEHQLAMWEAYDKEQARKKVKKSWKIVGEGIDARINFSQEATIADLFAALEDDETGELDEIFWSEIIDNFGKEVEDALRDQKIDKNTKLIDFFQQQGHDQDDLTAYLPLSFKKKRKSETKEKKLPPKKL